MNSASISVIMPAYRAAHTIGRAVDSVLAQTLRPREIIVIDDGSPDDLAGTLQPYADHITLLTKPNGGAASARNTGIDAAWGDYLAFLDADDYWEPDKLERQYAILATAPTVGVVSSWGFVQTPGKGRVLPPHPDQRLCGRILRPAGAAAFRIALAMWTSGLLVRRRALGAERFTSGLEPAEDRDLWVRLVTAGPIYLMPEPLTTAVLEPQSLSRSNLERDCQNMLRVVHKYAHLLGPQGVREQEATIYRRWAGEYLAGGGAAAAVRPAWRRLAREPLALEAWWILCKAACRASMGGAVPA